MKYKLTYTRRATKDIQELDPKIKKRIGKVLLRYEENPSANAVRLVNSELGTYRFRIGDYRVIFDLEGDEIVILRVGHRSDIYRRG
ncbi:MAG: type II toxin-antitoxin system RelE/ParE family toxin [Thermodesulfobacteriota bacterium]|nr:type II toxin-antitoxin system RelE/ParE family toxin [Thermodesulfobacteriota bacterium]